MWFPPYWKTINFAVDPFLFVIETRFDKSGEEIEQGDCK